MISQFFVLSGRGDCIVSRDYRDEVPKGSAEIFFHKVKFWKEEEADDEAPSVFNVDGVSYIHVKVAGMLFAATARANVSPSLVLELLQKIAQVVKDHLGVLDENSLQADSLLVYELLDKIIGSSKTLPRAAQIKLVSQHPEVYEPCDDSFALVDALLADRANLLLHRPAFCMEIGCGSGYVIASLAIMLGLESFGSHYFATDINLHAIETTRRTLEAHGVHAEIVAADIASGLQQRLKGMVDVVVVNPPYVPTPEEEVGQDGIAASWAGGENGRRVIDRILPVADELLSQKGWLYMVTLTANNPSEICRLMRERGYNSKIIVQRSTEEESLHVIKFWREKTDEEREGNGFVASWMSHFSRLSFRKNSGNASQLQN